MIGPTLRVIAWETTRRCPLRCRHCRGAARDANYEGEFTTEEGRQLIDAFTAFGKPLLIFTGGEPLCRPDIFTVLEYARLRGFPTAVATCGHRMNAEVTNKLVAAGVHRVSISLDGPDAAVHDGFRGVQGAFATALRSMEFAREAGLAFQINTTVSRVNAHLLPKILQMAETLKAVAFDLFFLVPTGRGAKLREEEISSEDYETVLGWVAEIRRSGALPVKVTCAPHFSRILAQRKVASPEQLKHESRGCMAGRDFLFVSHQGILQPCGFLDVPCGDVRKAEYDVARLWNTSAPLQALRNPSSLEGACGTCMFNQECGGCRARAYAATGNILAAEPKCVQFKIGSRA